MNESYVERGENYEYKVQGSEYKAANFKLYTLNSELCTRFFDP